MTATGSEHNNLLLDRIRILRAVGGQELVIIALSARRLQAIAIARAATGRPQLGATFIVRVRPRANRPASPRIHAALLQLRNARLARRVAFAIAADVVHAKTGITVGGLLACGACGARCEGRSRDR